MLSIIIIAKNEEKYLPRLLHSIKMQEFKDYEIILSDAHSTDRTREIAKNFGCKVIDGGLPSKGRNEGAKAAKYDMLLFLDSDVVLPPLFLQENLSYIKHFRIDCGTPLYKPISAKNLDKVLFNAYNLWANNMQYFYPYSAGFCIFCKKEYWQKVGGFNEKILIAEDHAFVNSVVRAKGKFRIIKRIPILVDVRRLDKEGRFNLIKKYLKVELSRITKKDLEKDSPINYVLFGHDKCIKEIYKENSKRKVR